MSTSFADLDLPPQPWHPYVQPDPAEWAEWVYGLDREQLARYLEWVQSVRHVETECFMQDHARRIDSLTREVQYLRDALDRALRRGHVLTTTIKDGTA